MKFTNHTGVAKNQDQVIKLLQIHLATALDLHSQVKQAHWNVKGPSFFGIHKMFDELTDKFNNPIDIVAERISALGGYPMGYVSAVASASILDNPADDLVQDLDWVAFILDQYHSYSKLLYDDIKSLGDLDPISQDILIEIARMIDQGIYFLAAHLEDNTSNEVYETGADQNDDDNLSGDSTLTKDESEILDDGSDKVL